ncbi:hypothetical protein X897_6193 [Burkholderia pseudomallei ABCPW 30]|nr:hypothetical protein X897_6193 [Burkholderia pseudomallei ABCPW 30]
MCLRSTAPTCIPSRLASIVGNWRQVDRQPGQIRLETLRMGDLKLNDQATRQPAIGTIPLPAAVGAADVVRTESFLTAPRATPFFDALAFLKPGVWVN